MVDKAYRLSPLAEADLDEIWLYTRDHWSVQQADQYVSDILDVCEKLANGESVEGAMSPTVHRYASVAAHSTTYVILSNAKNTGTRTMWKLDAM